jgi:hypothetical protein
MVQVAASTGLRDGALDPGAVRVAVSPGRGGLLGADAVLGLVLRAGPEGEMTGVGGRAGAVGPVGGGRAVGGAEGHLLPPRRLRALPRAVKRKMSRFPLKRDPHRHWPQPTRPPDEAVMLVAVDPKGSPRD